MRRGSGLTITPVITLLGLAIVAAAVYAGVKAFPAFFANWQFQDDFSSRVRLTRMNARTPEQLRDSLYRDAQRYGISLDREDINVEMAPTGDRIARVNADYQVPIDLHFFQASWHFHPQYPQARPISFGDPRTLSALGLIFGLFWFFKGFGVFRKYRILADTPEVPIRGVAMGLVEIHGKAVSERTLVSPVSHLPCLLYKVDVDRWVGNRWSHYLSDAAWVKFFLEDETGKVLIDAAGAEFDLELSAREEVSSTPRSVYGHAWEADPEQFSGPGFPASESELRLYVSRVASGMRSALFQGADLAPDGGFTSQSKKVPWWQSAPNILATIYFARSSSMASSMGRSSGGYRLTERCIVPGQTYDITGTCVENPAPKNEQDRNIIVKGKNSPTFLISCRSEQTLESDLRARALRYIVCGGILAVGCLAALLQLLGYI